MQILDITPPGFSHARGYAGWRSKYFGLAAAVRLNGLYPPIVSTPVVGVATFKTANGVRAIAPHLNIGLGRRSLYMELVLLFGAQTMGVPALFDGPLREFDDGILTGDNDVAK